MFIPGTRNPDELDLAMRTSLAESLSYICSEARSDLALTDADVATALDEIRAHRIKPAIFARYYKLVLALQDGDVRAAQKLISEILKLSRHHATFRVLPFNDEALGDDRTFITELINPDSRNAPMFEPPREDQWISFQRHVSEALDIIQRADRPLAAELRGVTTEVIGAAPSSEPNARPFGSISSFMLWGALTVNVSRHNTTWSLVEALVHESAHQLLFAHSIEEPLVTNSIDERYTSPLRADPRPMDGVFHATFVTARVHYALARIQAAISPDFAPIDADTVEARLTLLKRLYAGGLETVRMHAKLTPTGQQIIEESADYMKAA